jgi:hypothetical protein
MHAMYVAIYLSYLLHWVITIPTSCSDHDRHYIATIADDGLVGELDFERLDPQILAFFLEVG